MAKTNIKVSNGQIVVHDSDGKNSALPVSAGQSIKTTSVAGKVVSSHGQVAGTSVVHDNPA